MASVRLIALLILTLTNATADTSLAPQQHDCGGLRGDGSCAATTTSVCRNSRGGNQISGAPRYRRDVHIHTGGVQNFASAAGRVRRCSKIEGDLLIDHVELASLPFLTEVTGSIFIGSEPQYDGGNLHTLRREQPCLARSTKLEAVSLDALLVVKGGLWIRCTEALTQVSFGALEEVGDALKIEHNAQLKTLGKAFPVLQRAGYSPSWQEYNELAIRDNAALVDLTDAFPRLTSVAQTLRIDNNPALTSIDHAFASLQTCGSLQLTELPSLRAVPADAFASLAEVKGNVAGPSDVWLGYCDKLASIDAGAFPKLRLVSGDVWLLFSPDLASISGSFPALRRVDGFVHVHGLDSLQTLDGVMPYLETAGGIQISDSSALTSLENGFPRLSAVSGHLAIFGLPALEATTGFAALETVGDLDIYSNPALTDINGFAGLKTANLVRVHHNLALERVDGFEELKTLGDDDDTEPALVVLENGDRGITMNAFGTLERGGWAALQRGLDASALCASALVAQDEAPCYCGDATDDCFEHADVIRDLTKYVDKDDDDEEDDVEAIAPAPRQAPPAGWGKLLSA